MILSNISGQHLNNVGVRLRIGLNIVETAFLYISRKNVSCATHQVPTKMFSVVSFINLLRVQLSFTLERAASNEYPLQLFSLRNKKMALWVSIGLDLVPSSLYCKDILASDNRGKIRIGKWWRLAHPHESP